MAVIGSGTLDTLPHKIDRLLAHHNALRRGLNLDEIDPKGILDSLTAMAPKLLPYAETVWRLLDIKRLPVASYLPGLVIAPVLVGLFAR